MSLLYEFFGEIRNNAFGSTVQFWRNTFIEWSDLGNSHEGKCFFLGREIGNNLPRRRGAPRKHY